MSRKKEAKLLLVVGFVVLFVGCFWLGPTVDFFMVLLTQKNITPQEIYPLLSYTWVAPATLSAMYLGSELLLPNKKKLIVTSYCVIGILFEFFLWFDTVASFTFNPYVPGVDLIDTSFNSSHPTFFIIVVLLVSILVFLVIGSLIKAKQSSGEIRKKFIFITIGFTIFLATAIADTLLSGPIIGIFRMAMMTFAIWLYLGLKT